MRLYLVRHGQAGSRDDYDRLSDLGQEQIHALAAYWSRQGLYFDRIVSGALRRQRESASILSGSRESEVDPHWSEFDLDAVYNSVAPRLAESDESFRRAYEEVLRDSQDPSHSVHRTWRPADMAVVQAWVSGRMQPANPEAACETWPQFESRIHSALASILDHPAENILVATSATPIGIVVASLFGDSLPHAFHLAGAQYNSAVTVLEYKAGCWRLSHFNQIGHLDEARLHTLR